MTESPNDRISALRRAWQPEVDRRNAERAAERSALPYAPSRKGFEWVTLDENIRRAMGAVTGEDVPTPDEAPRKNAVVFSCLSVFSFAFPEAYLDVLGADKSPVPDHPALAMLRAMPSGMSESELMRYAVLYMALGGCRLKKVRATGDGRVLGLVPYHRNQVRPIRATGRSERWIIGWEQVDGGKVVDTWDASEVIALNWPVPDPRNAGDCLSPLEAIAAEYGQDNEMTRYLTSLLENDAVARTIILTPTPPPGMVTADASYRRDTREAWQEQYGGAGRGAPAVMSPGQTVERLSLSLEEMAFDALRRVPESRICAAFRVPAQLAGVTAGLDSGTYANYAEARKAFTQGTLVPLWRYVSDQLTRGLRGEFGERDTWEYWHVTADVAALQEDANATAARQAERSRRIQELQTAYTSGALTREMAIANAVTQLGEPEESAAALFPTIAPPAPPAPTPDTTAPEASPAPADQAPSGTPNVAPGDTPSATETDAPPPTDTATESGSATGNDPGTPEGDA